MASLNLNPSLNDNSLQFLFEGYSSSLKEFINETFRRIVSFDPEKIKKDFDKWKKEAQAKIKLFKQGKLDEDALYKWMEENK